MVSLEQICECQLAWLVYEENTPNTKIRLQEIFEGIL